MIKQFTSQEVEERFEQLPKEVQAAVTAGDIGEKLENVAKKHGLRVDQFGELVDETGMVMMGLRKAKYFISDLESRLDIDKSKAEAIAKDINLELFASIKKHLMEMQTSIPDQNSSEGSSNDGWGKIEKEQNAISDIEKVGDFTIEKPTIAPNEIEITERKNHIISSIENPAPAPKKILPNNTESLVDHLLSTPTVIPPAPAVPIALQKNIANIPQKPNPDPYKEPIN